MRFQTPLVPARLLRRYKRFLADVELQSGVVVVAHCPNPGSMMGLKDEGARVWLEPNDDPKKKLKYGWRLVEVAGGHFAGIDAGSANGVVAEALQSGAVPELAGYEGLRREVKYGQNSRIDFLLSQPGLPDAYVEVKSVTLRRGGDLAEFPDSVTARGAKHLAELAAMAQAGQRAVMFYLIQRTDCAAFDLAGDIDPAYAAAFAKARLAGVEVLCYACRIDPLSVSLGRSVPLAPGL
ncbi:DNA/RNA nuclease SfsA [Alphaproteobacteria bacterium KMM 3653]|uniref:Sugar fermentation stimulation protein homolog n=1 Tax=Harenicola maris TaxID=2841044 RepID=A0AAP2CPF1_9RHOB|nr:DNA/RNA nuclease SfsA [Harenicola maris]